MYLEINDGYVYLGLWKLTIYMKQRRKVRITFIEMQHGVFVGEWFIGWIWER